jgi:hypothetical protein
MNDLMLSDVSPKELSQVDGGDVNWGAVLAETSAAAPTAFTAALFGAAAALVTRIPTIW